MANRYLDPNRPLPVLLGQGLDGIVDKVPYGGTPEAPTERARRRRYGDALALCGTAPDHEKREVHGAELQANLRAYGTTVDLLLVAQAQMRADLARRRKLSGMAHVVALNARGRRVKFDSKV